MKGYHLSNFFLEKVILNVKVT